MTTTLHIFVAFFPRGWSDCLSVMVPLGSSSVSSARLWTGTRQLQWTLLLQLLEPSATVGGGTEINPRTFVTNLSRWPTSMRHFSAEVLIYWYLLCFFFVVVATPGSGLKVLRLLDWLDRRTIRDFFFFLKVSIWKWEISGWVLYLLWSQSFIYFPSFSVPGNRRCKSAKRFTAPSAVCFSGTVRSTWNYHI